MKSQKPFAQTSKEKSLDLLYYSLENPFLTHEIVLFKMQKHAKHDLHVIWDLKSQVLQF